MKNITFAVFLLMYFAGACNYGEKSAPLNSDTTRTNTPLGNTMPVDSMHDSANKNAIDSSAAVLPTDTATPTPNRH